MMISESLEINIVLNKQQDPGLTNVENPQQFFFSFVYTQYGVFLLYDIVYRISIRYNKSTHRIICQ